MRKLVLFIGPAGAGKTTIAKALMKRRKDAVFLDMDATLRPAAEAIMSAVGLDPNDRDSDDYKRLCRDLGYRMTMNAALENLELGVNAYVVGPLRRKPAKRIGLTGSWAASAGRSATSTSKSFKCSWTARSGTGNESGKDGWLPTNGSSAIGIRSSVLCR